MFISELSKGIAFHVNGLKDEEERLKYFFLLL